MTKRKIRHTKRKEDRHTKIKKQTEKLRAES